MTRVFEFLLIIVVVSSCNIVDDDYSVVPKSVQPHVDEFIRIARSKGLNISQGNLKVYFKKMSDADGKTYFNDDVIYLDSTGLRWDRYREQLIFHELGHLYLGRKHDNREFKYGELKSIMNANDVPYYSDAWAYQRKYYIDELFNPDEPKPDWAD